MLGSDDMIRIAKEATLGMEPTDNSEEALAFRKQVDGEIAQAKAAGQAVDLPFEVPES